jgi:hypothetical protein
LDTSGHSWKIESGKKHWQLRIDDRLVGILPSGANWGGRALKNTIAQVRHHISGGRP